MHQGKDYISRYNPVDITVSTDDHVSWWVEQVRRGEKKWSVQKMSYLHVSMEEGVGVLGRSRAFYFCEIFFSQYPGRQVPKYQSNLVNSPHFR